MEVTRKVIVAGSSSGIGEATAIRFACEGWDVCLNARRKHKLEEVRHKLPPGHHLICPGDAADPATAEAGASWMRWSTAPASGCRVTPSPARSKHGASLST
jgi:NADP-dependent 3-hydroxy acid dehydrogenase YdfG